MEISNEKFLEAMLVRNALLHLLRFGTSGSNDPIPMFEHGLALKHVLGYSSSTMTHFNVLYQGWRQARSNRVSSDYGDLKKEAGLSDMVVRQEGECPTVYLTEKVLHPLKRSLPNDDGENLAVVLFQDNERMDGTWVADYDFSPSDPASRFAIGDTSKLQPEKAMLLQFWFAPWQLSRNQVEEYACQAGLKREFLKFNSETELGHFRQFKFEYNTLSREEAEARANNRNSEKQHKRRPDHDNFLLSVVQLGTVLIGNQKYYVYTGSEVLEPA